MAVLSSIVFDINQTLLDLQSMARTFERILIRGARCRRIGTLLLSCVRCVMPAFRLLTRTDNRLDLWVCLRGAGGVRHQSVVVGLTLYVDGRVSIGEAAS
jgi:hypothetical protein